MEENDGNIFSQMFIDANRITLKQISFIWMSLGFLMGITTFLNLDWKFDRWNLPYQFDTTLERSISDNQGEYARCESSDH